MRKIVEKPELGGAVFEGTRILVANVQKEILRGVGPKEILRSYPALDAADYEAAKKYDPKTVIERALRSDGPTILEYVQAGYDPKHYPPNGWEAKPFTPAEKAEAEKFHADREERVAEAERAAASSAVIVPPVANPPADAPVAETDTNPGMIPAALADAGANGNGAATPFEHTQPPTGYAPCTRTAPHPGEPCAHPLLEKCPVTGCTKTEEHSHVPTLEEYVAAGFKAETYAGRFNGQKAGEVYDPELGKAADKMANDKSGKKPRHHRGDK